jgi:hypothetical protein
MTWRKASQSVNGNCVEVRGDLQALRDSKAPSAIVPVDRTAMAHLVTVLKSNAVA